LPKEVIGFYISNSQCLCSKKELNKPLQSGTAVLYWLANSFKNSLNLFYDLDLAVASILSRCNLSIAQLQTLLGGDKINIGQCNIAYIVGKYFGVRAGTAYESPYAGFADASQYFVAPLETPDSQDYAFECAVKAQEAGKEVVAGLKILGVTDPQNLVSPVNQFQKKWARHFSYPTIDDLNEIDENIGFYFYEALSGGWFEALKRGAIESAWNWDIHSCYSSLLCTLPDFRLGTFHHVTEMTDAPLGVYNCNIDINAKLSPISYRTKDRSYNPNGIQENKKLVKMTIEDILDYNLGEVEIIDGYEWTPIEWKPIYAPLMKRLYELKEQNEGIRKDVIKRTSNGLWGLMGQVIRNKKGGRFGEYANPMIHCLVEQHARSKVFRACMNNGVIPIAVEMDGITTPCDMPNLALGEGMGEWKCTHANVPCLSLNANLVLLAGKSNHAIFGVEYEWMKNEIEKDPENHIYSMTRNSCITAGKVVNNPKLLPQLGEIVPTTRSVDITADTKRLWADSPQTGTELLSGKTCDSLPLSVEMIDLMNLDSDEGLLTNTE